MKKITLTALALATLIGCTKSKPHISLTHNKFRNHNLCKLDDLVIKANKGQCKGDRVELKLEITQDLSKSVNDNSFQSNIIIVSTDKSPYIKKDNIIRFILDGKNIDIKVKEAAISSSLETISTSGYTSYIGRTPIYTPGTTSSYMLYINALSFDLSKEMLEQIANSAKTTLEIEGDKYHELVELKEKEKAALKEFVNVCISKTKDCTASKSNKCSTQ